MKLTDTNLAKAISEAKAKTTYKTDFMAWDDDLHGFGLRVRNGKRTWIFQYNIGKQTYRVRIGAPEQFNCAQARELAKVHSGDVSKAKQGLGEHPAAVVKKTKAEKKAPRGQTLGSLVTRYLEARERAMKPRSYAETKRHLEQHWKPLHKSPLQNIGRADVVTRFRELAKKDGKKGGPVAANRARASLSAMFAWGIREGVCEANPVAGSAKDETENGPRERALSDAEVAKVWLAAEKQENDYGRIVRLLLLTGCRRDEIGGLQWSEIDTEARTITLPPERTKNGSPHVVPLCDAAIAILGTRDADREHVFGRGQGGFSGWSKAKAALDDDAKLKEAWTLHDLRRTVRTGLGKLGVAPHVAEAVLNHLPPKLIRTYDRNTYAAEKKAALDLWASHLKVAVAQASGANVTPLRKA